MAEILANNLYEKPPFKLPAASRIIFSASSKGAWKMIAGDSYNWAQEVSGKSFVSAKGGLKVTAVGGSRALEWSGNNQSQFYWQSSQNLDLIEFAGRDKSIVMTYRVDRRPQNKVIQRIDCKWPCSGSQDVTELFSSVPLGEWVRSGISLACFEKAGADLSRVNTPMLLTTSGLFAITIKDVRIAAGDPEVAVSCY